MLCACNVCVAWVCVRACAGKLDEIFHSPHTQPLEPTDESFWTSRASNACGQDVRDTVQSVYTGLNREVGYASRRFVSTFRLIKLHIRQYHSACVPPKEKLCYWPESLQDVSEKLRVASSLADCCSKLRSAVKRVT